MPCFEILEHTADTGFRAWGSTLEELFIHAAEALIEVALDPSAASAWAPRQIAASGSGPEELLVNWLNEVLYLLDGERFVPARFEVVWFEESEVGPAIEVQSEPPNEPPSPVKTSELWGRPPGLRPDLQVRPRALLSTAGVARDQPSSILKSTVIGQLLGESRDDAKHPPRIVVKAATFHQLRIGEHNGRWEAEVYLDV